LGVSEKATHSPSLTTSSRFVAQGFDDVVGLIAGKAAHDERTLGANQVT
jgi:hypothetical protein